MNPRPPDKERTTTTPGTSSTTRNTHNTPAQPPERQGTPPAHPVWKVAALTVLAQSDVELSLQQHLDLAPDLVLPSHLAGDDDDDDDDDEGGDIGPDPLMMAQPVPHQATTDKKRVKVYELRNNDWFDRGTGFCSATVTTVRFWHPLLVWPALLCPRPPSASSHLALVCFLAR